MTEYALGNIYVREGYLEHAGDKVDTHAHNFPHVTYIVRGEAEIQILADNDDVVQSVTKRAEDGRNWALIVAGKKHRIIAKVDGTRYHCIYAHRNPQGDVVQEYDGWSAGNT